MKLIPLLWLILLSGCHSAPDISPPPVSDEINLQGKLPEDFDWPAYFDEGDQSVSSDMIHAQAATAVLKQRMDELCAQYRALMAKRGETEALKLFNEMQEHWQKSADAEVAFVGSPWDGGSGARAAYPMERFKVYLQRVKDLKELKNDSLFLNE